MLFFFSSLQLILDVFASEVKKICILNISNFLISSYKTAGYHLTRWNQLKIL